MKPTEHDLTERINELKVSMEECRSNLRLEESFLKEDISALQDAQLAVNRRKGSIELIKRDHSIYDRELAELDGRLKEYTMAGTVRRPKADKKRKAPSVAEAVDVLKNLDPAILQALLNK